METRNRPFWEAAYQDPDVETFGSASEEVGELAGVLPPGARALDMGCGDGRNALCLAEHGVEVDAFDVSLAGIEKLHSRARATDARIQAWVQDINTFSFRREYELVVLPGVLHLLEREVWRRVLESVRRHTSPGGWNVVVVFTNRIPPPPDLADHMRGLFTEGELREQYRAWSVNTWEAYILEDEHPGGARHR
ncbi:MAG TPA: methyltransferase domain-containing protein, partial [Longimicrobiales bacterium]|nr:methyltransferase domain-containing protein [Longimicrobiales bacterium]